MRTLAPDAKTEAVRNLLASAPTLLVMDNFETVAEAEQTRIAEFLANAPCAALVTSRQITPRARNVEIDAMGETEAREFVDKLIEVSPRRQVFKGLDAKQIITTAEANPLVMEWVVAQIAEAAHEPRRVFDELAHGKGDAAQRVFDRSFNLPSLGDDGRAALLALTLFIPNATREALAGVAGLDAERIDNAISRLVSLRLAETTTGNARIGVRGLTRELARTHREQDQRSPEWTRRFVDYFVRYSEAHAKTTPEDLNALESERENLLSTMDNAFDAQDWQSVMRVIDAIAFPGLLDIHGYWDDAIVRGEQAAEAARKAVRLDLVPVYQGHIAAIRKDRGEYDAARRLYEDGLKEFRQRDDELNVAVSLHQLGIIVQHQGDFETARAHYAESLEIEKKLGNQSAIALTLGQLGNLAMAQGDYSQAKEHYHDTLDIFKKLGSQSEIAITLHQLGNVAYQQGDYEMAQARYAESLEIEKRLGNQSGIASSLHQFGQLAEIAGNREEAKHFFNRP